MWIKAYHPTQNTAVRRSVFLACSAFNLVSVYLVVYLAGKLTGSQHITEQGVVLVTFLLTGVQVGQAVGVQQYISRTPSPAFALIVCLLSLIVISQLYLDTMLQNFILTGIGAICGYFLSYKVAYNLTSQDKWRFQALTSIRYIIIGVCILVLILSRTLSVTALIATVVITTGLLSIASNSKERIESTSPSPKKMYVGLITILSGIGLSLIYRNDINIVRDLYSGTGDFTVIHNLLIVFSVVTAGAGFVVTNYVYTKINDRGGAPLLFNRKTFSIVYALLLLTFLIALPVLSVYVKIIACTLIAIVCPVFSAFLHLKSKSNIVYVIGAGSLILVMFVMRQWLGISPLNAFLVYNLTTLSCLYVVSVYCMTGVK